MTRHPSPVQKITSTVSRLTLRDHSIIRLLGDHGVLTTDQIASVFFTSVQRARARLLVLHRLDLVDRFRSRLVPGREQWHHVLAFQGARLHAAATGQTPPVASRVATTIMRLASSPTLPHRLGTNDFFIRLLAAIRERPGAELAEWVSESAAAEECGGRLRPDAAAVYREPGRELAFWFEHDRGTETLATLSDKAEKYRDTSILAAPRAVVFELPNLEREQHLHEHLTGRYYPYPLATTHRALTDDPTAPAWRLLHGQARVRLIDITR